MHTQSTTINANAQRNGTSTAAPLTDNRLTIADLDRHLSPDMNRSAIQRYDQNVAFARLLGKEGGSYPAASLLYWKHIAEARKQKPPLVRPETAHLFIAGLMENPPMTEDRLPITGAALASFDPHATAAATVREFVASADLPALATLIGHGLFRAQMDSLVLTAPQAARVLHVSVRTLRRHFPPYRRIGETARGERWLLSRLLEPETAPEGRE